MNTRIIASVIAVCCMIAPAFSQTPPPAKTDTKTKTTKATKPAPKRDAKGHFIKTTKPAAKTTKPMAKTVTKPAAKTLPKRDAKGHFVKTAPTPPPLKSAAKTTTKPATKTADKASPKLKNLGHGVYMNSAGRYTDAKGKFIKTADAEKALGKTATKPKTKGK